MIIKRSICYICFNLNTNLLLIVEELKDTIKEFEREKKS